MTHSEILSKAEAAITGDVLVLTVTRIDSLNVTVDDSRSLLLPGKEIIPGKYGVVDIRVLVPLGSI